MKLATAGVLEFPSSYQILDEEEMMYVEGGENHIDPFWWGLNIYLDHNTTVRLRSSLGSVASIASILTGILVATGTTVIVAGVTLPISGISAIVSGITGLASSQLLGADKGKGVRIRMTGFIIPTGVFSR
jgi:hypothetical protein